MLKKLKSESGMAFVLVMLFTTLMILLTGRVMKMGETDSRSLNDYQTREASYFVVKSNLNYYAQLLNGLQYVETDTEVPFDIISTLSYKEGAFQFVDDADNVLPEKLAEFEKFVIIDKLQKEFAYFQKLRSNVNDGSTSLLSLDSEFHKPHQVFEITIVSDNIRNDAYMGEPYTMTTYITFFGDTTSYDSFNSIYENTLRIKTVLQTDVTEYSGTDNYFSVEADPDDYTVVPNKVVYTESISCVPTLDETSGKVWTWRFN